jgi:hypothetical protein
MFLPCSVFPPVTAHDERECGPRHFRAVAAAEDSTRLSTFE